MSKLSKEFVLIYDDKVIAKCKDFSLEINKEIIDLTTLDSDGWREILADQKSWSISFNAVVPRTITTGQTGYDEILEEIKDNDELVKIALGEKEIGGKVQEGFGIITSLSTNVAVGDVVSYSGTFEGSGKLETVTVV